MEDFSVFGRHAFELYEAKSGRDTRQEQPDHIHWVRTTMITHLRCYSRLIRLR
jgi:hypothetical protein